MDHDRGGGGVFHGGVIFLTSSNNIINHQNGLTRFYSILLNLEEVLSIFLLERGLFSRTRQLPRFPNRSETSPKSQSQTGTEEETPSIKADYHIRFLPIVERQDL